MSPWVIGVYTDGAQEQLGLYSKTPTGDPCLEDLIPNFTDHDDLVAKMISPSGKAQVLDQLLGEASIAHSYDHAIALDSLWQVSLCNRDRIYQHVISGNFSKVLHALRENSKSGHRPDVLRNTVRNHARYLAVLVAHHKTAIIRAHSRQPWGSAFSGENEWKHVGHTLTSGIVSPAIVLQKIAKILERDALREMSEDQVIAYLIKEGVLSDDTKQSTEGRKFGMATWKLCNDIFYKLRPEHQSENTDFKQKVLRLADHTKRLSQLRRGHMKLAGFTAMTFNDLRMKTSPSEATAGVALNLLEQFTSIDKILDRPKVTQARPVIKCRDYSLKQLTFMTTLLRAETLPDKNAPMIGGSRGTNDGINETNNSSAAPVRSMLKKIEDPVIRRNLRAHLGFDVTPWFN